MSVTTLFGRPARYLPPAQFEASIDRSPRLEDTTELPVVPRDSRHDRPVDLAAIVRRVAATPSLWRKHARLDGADRSWTRIVVPEDVDVWVIVWGTSSRTELHDHGDAAAAFTTVRGLLTEIRPDQRGRLVPRRFAPGVVATVEPGGVHDVTNEFAEAAVSIHAYAPRLTRMTFYTRSADGLIVPDRVSETTLPEVH